MRALTESTALINFALIKDHSICGYTGALKNMTHGCSVNPQDFHEHHASPQIAILAAQDVLRSRLRLCIIDGFKLMAHGGPLYKRPEYVIPHEAVYVSTDPVAMDTIGWAEVEKARAGFHLKTLTDEGRAPLYIQARRGPRRRHRPTRRRLSSRTSFCEPRRLGRRASRRVRAPLRGPSSRPARLPRSRLRHGAPGAGCCQ